MRSTDRDLRAMRQLVLEGGEDDREPELLLPSALLDGLRSLLACEAVSVGIIDPTNGTVGPWQDLPPDAYDDTADRLAAFFRHYWDCLDCSYHDRTGDLDSVIATSDFYTTRQFHSTGMWSEYVAPTGFDQDMIACLAGVPGRTLRLLATRCRGRAFTERERMILWLLRPHLYRLYRQRQAARSETVRLTPRQHQLLGLVAAGRTNRQIGRELGIAESTARKHLQHIFERLDVSSRTAAVVRAFPPDDTLQA
jgi:DNA-binding CsgD family transcriptional regulator